MNWLSDSGQDRPAISEPNGGRDLFSRMMNAISG